VTGGRQQAVVEATILVDRGFAGCGKGTFNCHLEHSEESAFSQMPGEKQIPRATSALGMTKSTFFRSQIAQLRI
jgi:hypothetical protein